MNNDKPTASLLIWRAAALMTLACTAVAGVVMLMVGSRVPTSDQPAILWAAGAISLAGVLSMWILCAWLARRIRRDSEELAGLFRSARQGTTIPLSAPSTCGILAGPAESFRVLASEIQTRVGELESEIKGVKAILSAMEEGLVVIDSQKRVLMVNSAARKILSLPDGDLTGQSLASLSRQVEVMSNMDLSLSAAQTCSFEFQIAAEKRHVLARCSPYHDDAEPGGRAHGALAVFHDITELRRLERMRTEFVANVSHELRTPLTSLLGYLETLHDGGLTQEEVQKFLAVCRRQAERLSRIVEDLLRLSRLENPQQDVAVADIDLNQVLNNAVDQCQPLSEERNIPIVLDLPLVDAVILGDRGLLTQAVSNLIENAINYNREGGQVVVRLREFGPSRQWEIVVEDTGIGIPQESLGRIF
ncbi:MAG TPA: histidine kinase dimerization/phospho-acceptor domain-containing protein, partial [Planctomycetota bacterium]|nr:histidine kinase dimerization/phospho-acceptor domain-containing protein [Planctomycetota bacterium]